MNYVYPKLSDKDFGIFRLGGAGLGNILFTYARALVYSKKHNYQFIWPTWPSIKLGTIIRNEKDKRFYTCLFKNKSEYINSTKKICYLAFKSKLLENEVDKINNFDNKIIIFEKFIGSFEPIKYDYKLVYEDIIKNLNKKNKKALEFNFEQSICIHVRLGDFSLATPEQVKNGRHDSRLPIEWYVRVINDLRKIVNNDLKVWIFSDGSYKELQPILTLKNTERITFGTSIADILALSRSLLFIASGSSFSMWARYLGRLNTIAYKNQIKEYILTENDDAFEIEIDEKQLIPPEICNRIKSILCSKNQQIGRQNEEGICNNSRP